MQLNEASLCANVMSVALSQSALPLISGQYISAHLVSGPLIWQHASHAVHTAVAHRHIMHERDFKIPAEF